jgi:serine/threonine protein kinase
VGIKLGRYEIRSKIGEGGMGEVYLAQDTKLDRKVALKILPAKVAVNQERMRRFVTLIYIKAGRGVSSLWTQLVDGGAPKRSTDFKSDHFNA